MSSITPLLYFDRSITTSQVAFQDIDGEWDQEKDVEPLDSYDRVFPTSPLMFLSDANVQLLTRQQEKKARDVLISYSLRIHKIRDQMRKRQALFLRRSCRIDPKSTAQQNTSTFMLSHATYKTREWPKLPRTNPNVWHQYLGDVISFCTALSKVESNRLRYEPIDAETFLNRIVSVLEREGLSISGQSVSEISHLAAFSMLAVFGLGMKMESPRLTLFASRLLTRFGRNTSLTSLESEFPDVVSVVSQFWQPMRDIIQGMAGSELTTRNAIDVYDIRQFGVSYSDSIASDGTYIYVYTNTGLYKIGTGEAHTIKGAIYQHRTDYVRDSAVERCWLCCIGEKLYCRTSAMSSNCVDCLSTYDLSTLNELVFQTIVDADGKWLNTGGIAPMVSDGKYLYIIRYYDSGSTGRQPADGFRATQLKRMRHKSPEKKGNDFELVYTKID